MKRYFQKKFALSEQGAADLSKAVVACALTNIGLLLPMGLLMVFLEQMFLPLMGEAGVSFGLPVYLLCCALLLVILFGLEYVQYNATFLASYRESANMRVRLAQRLRELPLSFFGKRDLADLTTTIMSDSASIETAFSHFIPELIGAVVSTVLVGVGLWCVDWRMAIALLWVVPVAFVLAVGTRPLVDRLERKKKDVILAASDGIQECIENIQDIKANNRREAYLAGLEEKLRLSEKITIRLELFNGILVMGAQMVLRVGMATTVLVGAMRLGAGKLSFLMFLMFLIAATRLYLPLSSSLQNLSAVYSTLLVVERMKAIEEQPVQTGTKEPLYQGYDLTFDHVGFAYENGKTVLKDVSFTAKQGQVTALVGPSGGGKSTAAKLAARFWDVQSGRILLGGQDVREVEPEILLEKFSIVFQDVVLFNTTVMENIRIGKRKASDEEVLAAARAAQCEEFVSRLPEGYQTVIGENGSRLSGGERQRLSIARALLKDANVILLDESTASLDVENESKVQQAISNLVKDKTVLVIAHRMRTVAGADKIVVLKDGHVFEEGSPRELVQKPDGIYAHMAKLQTEAQEWKI